MFVRTPPAISGGCIALYGKKYALPDVLEVYAELMDHLTVRYGMEKSYVTADGWDLLPEPLSWPEPGKGHALAAWNDHAEVTDVLGDCALHRIGPFEAYAYLLGTDTATYDTQKKLVTLSDDRKIHDFATAYPSSGPCIDICGLPKQGEIVGISPDLAEKLRAIVLIELSRMRLRFTTSSIARANGETEVLARIGFPHAEYGAGEDWLRVRCVAPDGSDFEAKELLRGGN